DRRDILELAIQIGIENPRRVSGSLGGCFWVRIESQAVVENRRVQSVWGWMRKLQGPDCEPVSGSDAPVRRVGNWLAGVPRAVHDETWRTFDGYWFVDIVSQDVDYDTVARIIRAARNERFVELCSRDRAGSLDASDIASVMLSPLPED